MEERKIWLDNIRWMVIVLVVIYHAFYYYNNIDVTPMFAGLEANPAVEGTKATVTGVALLQYFVYPWFMLILFIISGIVANIVLQKKEMKAFLSERVHKLLVPSTLGILTIQWLGGYLISQNFLTNGEEIPAFFRYLIYCGSGTGALWFCQVLFLNCLLLAFIKKIDKKNRLLFLGSKSNLLVLILLTPVMVGAAQIFNAPITTYRMCFYPVAFLLGYYVFAQENVQATLKKYGPLLLIVGVVADILYIVKDYGRYYASNEIQNDPIAVVAGWFMVMGLLGVGQRVLNFSNTFTTYMNKAGWGIYIVHINVLLFTNTLLKPVVTTLPMAVIYFMEIVAGLLVSILLWEVLRRIPLLRWLLFGIRRKKNV